MLTTQRYTCAIVLVLLISIRTGVCSKMQNPVAPSDIHVRDPFVLPVPEEHRYYLYGTCLGTEPRTLGAYFSNDLKEWFGPVTVFRGGDDFWGTYDYWAPEVYHYQGKYYMFVSFKSDSHRRATHILVADRPLGPFKPLTPEPITPKDWECLDGTLFVDESSKPWIVFCHEWVQTDDGEMQAMPLSADLKQPAGDPVFLFKATQAPWVRVFPGWPVKSPDPKGYITDGPFIYRAKSGALLMLWSSFGEKGYAMGIARSKSGNVLGPWEQLPEPLVDTDGGHGMRFKDFSGKLYCTIHRPNLPPTERLIFLPVHESNDRLILDAK